MTLCDTGPMVALIDADDPYHQQCAVTATSITATMVTTWPCFTEAMHLLYRAGGFSAQNELWAYVIDGSLRFHLPGRNEWKRIHELMGQYADLPLDVADASLVSAAEVLGDYQLFTVDESLRAVRTINGKFFNVVP